MGGESTNTTAAQLITSNSNYSDALVNIGNVV